MAMHWRHRDNNVKNWISIDLKCSLDLVFCMEFSPSCSIHRHKKEIKNTWSLLFCKEIPLSCFYLQLKFDNDEHNCQHHVLSEILQRKTLYQVSFYHDFLEMYWLIEKKVFSIIALHQIKPYNFQWRQKNKRIWSLHRIGFSAQFESDLTLTEVKNTQKTHKK